MTQHADPDEREHAEHLQTYGDALVEGTAPPPRDDLEATMRHVQRTLAGHQVSSGPVPSTVKATIWEDLMQTTTPTVEATLPTLLPVPSTVSPTPHRNVSLPPGGGWAAVASLALLLAIVTALVAVPAVQQFGLLGSNPPPPAGTANQGLYDPDDLSTYPMMPETCVSNGEVASDAELAQRSIDDWVPPAYVPAKAVPYETGEAIQETYMHFLRCERERFDQAYPPGSTPPSGTPVPLVGPSSEMLSYFSDRMRYDRLDRELSPDRQDALAAYRCEPGNTTVLETFPLPVNQPQDYAIWSLLPYIDEIDELAQVFAPSDVYLLPDGRYGAVQGSVSTAALTDPNAVTADDHLLFIAFVEDDGRYYIDEMFTVFGPMMDELEARGRNGTLVADCE